MTEIPDPASCVGNCDVCTQPEACKDARICLEHSGNTTKINSLMERTATFELKIMRRKVKSMRIFGD
jgi:hypothetical protein